MGTIQDMIERVNKIDLDTMIPILVQQHSYEIIALNNAQLYKGIRSDDQKVTPHYASLKYAANKAKLNSAPGFTIPDLFVTGAFYKGFGVVVNSKEYTVNSVDEKASKLELEYGSEIYGLNEENRTDFSINTLLPAIRGYITEVAGI